MIDYMPESTEVSQELTTDNFAHFSTVEEAYENGFTRPITLSSELDKRITETQTRIQLLHEQYGELALVRRSNTAHYEVLAHTPVEEAEPAVKESTMRRMARTVFGR